MSTFYRHVRPENPKKGLKEKTVTGIYNEKNHTLKIGVSTCSLNDQFNKKLGRKISSGRAQVKPDTIIESKDYRAALENFHTYCNSLGGKQVKLKSNNN